MSLIKTKEFILRHLKMSDAETLLAIEIDKDNIKNMMSYTSDINEIKKSIREDLLEYKKSKPNSEVFIIETPLGVAGYVSIHSLNKPNEEHKCKISYAIHPSFRGKGFATKAVKLLTVYAFKKYKLNRIEARCRSFNKASARVLEKAGFTFEGIHKKDIKKGTKYLDNTYWAIVK